MDAPFLSAIAADPTDDGPRLVYADWLEECGDLRGEYLRLLVLITAYLRRREDYEERRERFLELSRTVPHEWRRQVGKRFDVVLESVQSDRIIDTVGAVRHGTGWGIKESRDLVHSVLTRGPKLVMRGLSLEDAEQLKRELETGTWHENMKPLPPTQTRCCALIQESNPRRM